MQRISIQKHRAFQISSSVFPHVIFLPTVLFLPIFPPQNMYMFRASTSLTTNAKLFPVPPELCVHSVTRISRLMYFLYTNTMFSCSRTKKFTKTYTAFSGVLAVGKFPVLVLGQNLGKKLTQPNYAVDFLIRDLV